MNTKAKIEKDEATAFLTGIVAATNRFSNAKTTPKTMRISSKLMESGANQQLVSKNITASVENEMFNMSTDASLEEESDQTKLDISHGDEGEEQPEEETISVGEPDLLDDLKAAEESLAHTGAEATPEAVTKPLKINSEEAAEPEAVPEPVTEPVAEPVAEPAPEEPVTEPAAESTPKSISEPTTEPTPEPDSETPLASEIPKEGLVNDKPEKVVQPAPDAFEAPLTAGSNKYGQMLEDALSSIETPTVAPVSSTPNPAAMNTPAVPSNPEINGVPSMNYMPLPDDQVLAPPPTPPIDMSSPLPESQSVPTPTPAATPTTPVEPIAPAMPPVENPTNLGAQPAMQDQIYAPQASDPGAFRIPGM
jgi:hypothetical protein